MGAASGKGTTWCWFLGGWSRAVLAPSRWPPSKEGLREIMETTHAEGGETVPLELAVTIATRQTITDGDQTTKLDTADQSVVGHTEQQQEVSLDSARDNRRARVPTLPCQGAVDVSTIQRRASKNQARGSTQIVDGYEAVVDLLAESLASEWLARRTNASKRGVSE